MIDHAIHNDHTPSQEEIIYASADFPFREYELKIGPVVYSFADSGSFISERWAGASKRSQDRYSGMATVCIVNLDYYDGPLIEGKPPNGIEQVANNLNAIINNRLLESSTMIVLFTNLDFVLDEIKSIQPILQHPSVRGTDFEWVKEGILYNIESRLANNSRKIHYIWQHKIDDTSLQTVIGGIQDALVGEGVRVNGQNFSKLAYRF